jgi:DNA-binding NtrC family response regulator
VAINCGGLVDGVVASELFGHVAGAFSGADSDRAGLVEVASGGTLLLDEIGDATPQLQVSLLRLLQNREYRPVGGNRTRTTDARFVAATNVRLDAAVTAGRFRQDLLSRLRRWVIDVPPLRQRRQDIVPIALHVARERAGPAAIIERPLAAELLLHRWADNVRGLCAIVESAAIDADGGVLRLTPRVREQLADAARAGTSPAAESPVAGSDELSRYRKQQRPGGDDLTRRLSALDGNVKALALELGVSRNTLYRWFREEDIDPAALRSGPPPGRCNS